MYFIEGKKIYLKSITYDDTDNIVKWRNKESIKRNFIYQGVFTRESHEQWMQTEVDTGKVVQMIIFTNNDNFPVGSVYLRDIDTLNRKAEYGIFIGEENAQGRGYGTEAAHLMLEFAFEKLKLHKVYLRVLEENKAAQKSYEKAGFIKEALLYDDVCIHGIYKNIILMGKLED